MANNECVCNSDDMECDWVLKVTVEYFREGHPEAMSQRVPAEVKNIPQVVAQALLSAHVDAVNRNGAKIYAGILTDRCGDPDSAKIVTSAMG